ncbi:PIG-L family deacetylase [Arthrobacter sp. MSA 4-2]|uniref:PIG-L deacetylase family protein n=1 Tax=Arthrobacter sp. MSA 4-2 TaxID=2794349 RepID=UPI0018E893E1|nr:PIG-L family deacetylase [Arthrobacter sp. MSA 4-2]MBJ2119434.1 PIG-L family deacetylase [Arthrobacter sp. MSA 4-2]
MTAAPPSRLAQSRTTDEPWLFLSPHLDDAVLSCGSLIASEAGRRDIEVLTIFTECSPTPHTRAARSFLRQCSVQDAGSLFEERKKEDAAVLEGLGVRFRHLGATDALFRRRRKTIPGSSVLGRTLPELVHRYPTYRFDIALGRVSRGDTGLIEELRDTVAEEIDEQATGLVFCPVGIGRHVDHLITRSVGESSAERTVFYSDFPYNQNQQPDDAFLRSRHLTGWEWSGDLEAKHRRVRQYATQADALFPDGRIPPVPETYYS